MENIMNTNDKYYKNLTAEMFEKVLSEMPNNPFDYPKYHGEGIYEISKGCFTNEKGMKEFNKSLKDSINENI